MSLAPRPELKTPWNIEKTIRDINFYRFGITTKEEKYSLEYILGENWGNMDWFETYDTLKTSGMPIVISDDYGIMMTWIESEWKQSGRIIPGKRMVLIEKRKKYE